MVTGRVRGDFLPETEGKSPVHAARKIDCSFIVDKRVYSAPASRGPGGNERKIWLFEESVNGRPYAAAREQAASKRHGRSRRVPHPLRLSYMLAQANH